MNYYDAAEQSADYELTGEYRQQEDRKQSLAEYIARRGCAPACTRIQHVRECPNY